MQSDCITINNLTTLTVIVGGGFVGLFTALHLSHRHYSEPVILIDSQERFVFKPLLYEYLIMSLIENTQPQFQQPVIIAQEVELPQQSQNDSLIDYGAEHLIDVGVVLIAITIVIIIGMISKQTEKAILFALGLSAFLIIILWNI